MRTAYVQDPRPSHMLNHVDKSPAVNSESLIDTHSGHAPVISSRFANLCSTDAIDTLREIDAEPFAVTVNGRTVMVHPAPPSIPAQIIPAGSLMGIPLPASWVCPWAESEKPINPEGMLQ